MSVHSKYLLYEISCTSCFFRRTISVLKLQIWAIIKCFSKWNIFSCMVVFKKCPVNWKCIAQTETKFHRIGLVKTTRHLVVQKGREHTQTKYIQLYTLCSWLHENGSFSVHSFYEHILSIPGYTRSTEVTVLRKHTVYGIFIKKNYLCFGQFFKFVT